MAPSTKKKNRDQKIILFLLFVILILGGTVVGLFLKMKPQKPKVEEKPAEKIEEVKVKSAGKIAIIIDDFGYRNDSVSDGFLSLDAHLTYAVIPGHEHSQSMAKKAKSKGFEVIVHMPMGTNHPTFGEEDFILKKSMTSVEIEKRMNKVFTYLPEVVGMNNHQGSSATADQRVMNVVGTVLKQKGKYFLDSRTTKNTQAEKVMHSLGVPTGRRHVFLDNDFDENLIRQQLQELEAKARKQGFAVGIGHAKQHMLNVLKREIPKLKKQNFEFVFVSEVVK